MRRFWLVAVSVASLSLLGAAEGRAASLVPVGTFDQPIFVTSDPDNPDRLFVVERDGMVQLVEGESVSAFADLTALVSCCDSERGLLSIALSPNFADSGLLYASYTGTAAAGGAEGDIHVDAFTASGGGVDPGSRSSPSATASTPTTTAANSSSGRTATSMSRLATAAEAATRWPGFPSRSPHTR